jgi:hypothetical protein
MVPATHTTCYVATLQPTSILGLRRMSGYEAIYRPSIEDPEAHWLEASRAIDAGRPVPGFAVEVLDEGGAPLAPMGAGRDHRAATAPTRLPAQAVRG